MSMMDKIQGNTLNPLFRMAALAGVETAVKLHIRRGDNLNARDGGGLTPLMLAASKNRVPVCSLLVEAGADPALCDSLGRNALAIAIAAGATGVAEILSALVNKPALPVWDMADIQPERMTVISLDEDWTVGEFGNWEADEEPSPPEGDLSIAERAAAIHRSISRYVPMDTAEDWADFDVLLPVFAARPMSETDSSESLRVLLLRAVREGAVPEESVLRVCCADEEDDDARERLVRTLLAEAGVEPDERIEMGDEPHMGEPSEEEEAALSALISHADDLDSWRCDPARCYAREIRVGRLLSAEEEVLLGKEMEESIAVASKALAGWPVGLDELERIGKAVASGLVDATAYVISVGEQPSEVEAEPAENEEDEDDISSASGLNGEFLSGIVEISSFRRTNPGQTSALEAAIEKLHLAPSFFVGLIELTKGDSDAKTFRSTVERYIKARETMTLCNLRMVYNVVKRYQGLGLPFDDLLQEGNIGLMKAVERYDWRRGFKFSTYATWWIRQSASRAVADGGRTIRLPVHLNEKLSALRRATDAYETKNGKMPSDNVLAESLAMPIDRVSMLRARMQEPKPLHGLDHDGASVEESLSNDPKMRPEAVSERVSLIETLGKALSELDKHSADILTMRYGLDGTDSRTLEEIGQNFGVTRERIRQIESKALKKLALPSRNNALSHFFNADIPDPLPSPEEKDDSRKSTPRGRPRKSENEKTNHKANDETARMLLQKLTSASTISNACPQSKTGSMVGMAAVAETDAALALAYEAGAMVEDGRAEGGLVSVRLAARNLWLASTLLRAGFKPFPGYVYIK